MNQAQVAAALDELAGAVLESSSGGGRADRLTNQAIIPAQIQGFGMAHPKIYLI